MTATTIRVQMAQRKDTAANWTAANPILLSGEIGYETDTKKFKIGNGSTNWNSLAYLPIPDGSGNLTITGNLEIGSTGSLTFEGSTADGFETTLAVTNPTADRTITLPNQSGNVLVSGNASIIDADIAANAEIAVSKLADGTARQLLQTDAAGTGVEWASNVDIPGTLDVTGAATFDAAVTVAGDLTVNGTTTTISTQNLLVEDKNIIIGDVAIPTDVTADGGGITLKGATDKTINWVDATDAWTSSERFSVPLGSAASPSLTFTGDPNTGIYSPGADQVAISTNSAGRIHIGSTGTVNIVGAGSAGSTQAVSFNGSAPVNSLVIDSSGRVGIGSNSPGEKLSVVAGNIAFDYGYSIISNGGFVQRKYLWSAYTTEDTLNFGVPGSYDGYGAEATTARMTITQGGRVGIGTTSPAQLLHLNSPSANATQWIAAGTGYTSNLSLLANGSGGGLLLSSATDSSASITNSLNAALIFGTNNTERARIDSSGRLLVGTSSSSAEAKFIVQGGVTGSGGWMNIQRNATTASAGSTIGVIDFTNSSNNVGARVIAEGDGTWSAGTSHPTRLVFSTTADGASSPTERLRLNSSGSQQSFSANDVYRAASGQGAGTSFGFYYGYHSATTTQNGTLAYLVYTNGNVVNTNNSYAGISDAKLKENIVDATSQWSNIKALQVRKYNFKEGQTHTQIGLIAQEVELVSPGLVTESPDRDKDGNALGTVTKSVNYSVLYMKAVKALQEAMERIETLEAKVAALESA